MAFLTRQNAAATATHGIIAGFAEKSLDNLGQAIKSLKGSERSVLSILKENTQPGET